ncbi:MAG: class I SAM-dependent methyltransferase [Candidatus Omnitrophica bacterium]|jgi:predicted SAM-dependent methyltransferase|nr:class I SAM-dependent methyltransferase [Candidatus Omnitrophota bacterium]
MISTLAYKNKIYPKFQSEGFAAQFAFPFAKQVCTGVGLDIGCNRLDWCYPNAIPIDPVLNRYDAFNFPMVDLDYIFSSHCLEHLNNWVDAMDYWYTKLKVGGVLFLYLPDYSQLYWRPWNNKKHLHIFTPQVIRDYMENKGYTNIFNSERDLNNSFMIFGEK